MDAFVSKESSQEESRLGNSIDAVWRTGALFALCRAALVFNKRNTILSLTHFITSPHTQPGRDLLSSILITHKKLLHIP